MKNKAFRLFRKEHVPVDSTSGETSSVVRKREKQFVSARMLLGCWALETILQVYTIAPKDLSLDLKLISWKLSA